MQNSWDDYKFFIEIAKQKSLIKASKKLGVNHSTAFRRINNLEEKLKTKLFDRTNNYNLTLAGEQLMSEIKDLDEKIESANRKILGQDISLKGTIKLACSDTLGYLVIPQLISKFRNLHPEIVIDLIISPQIHDLSKREADIALRISNNPDEILVGKKICNIEVGIVGSSNLTTKTNRNNFDELFNNYNWISGASEISNQRNVLWMNKRIPQKNIVARANQMIAITKLIQEEVGFGIIPVYLTKILNNLKLLSTIPELETHLWILTHQDLRNNLRIKVLMEFLTIEIRKILQNDQN